MDLPVPDIAASYQRYFPLIRSKCTRMLRDPEEAQDVAQETFMKLWRERAAIDDAEAVLAWVYRTSTRLAIDRLRRRQRWQAVPVEEETCMGTPGHGEAAVDGQRLLARLAASVPADEMEAAILSRVDGMTHPEIAVVLVCSERTVRRLLTRFDTRVARLPERRRSA